MMRLLQSRAFYISLTIVALAFVLLANLHMVYVAAQSQPECVPHIKTDAAKPATGAFGAAKPSC